MLRFWRNPEFVRYLRAELRAPRAITAALLTLVVCVLVGLGCWSAERENIREFFRVFHLWVVGIQYVFLGVWCAALCGSAISRERELKTYDFLRTTRLRCGELLVGKVLGVPIMGYFAVACSLPISVVAGILGGYSIRVVLAIHLLLLVFVLFVAVVSLWISMLMEKVSAGAAALVTLFPIGLGFLFAWSAFPGFGAISVFPAILALYRADPDIARIVPTFFGVSSSFFLLTLFLYVTVGAWFVLMLVRNLKRDREQIRALTRWQGVGFVAFLNVLFYAFLDPRSFISTTSLGARLTPDQASQMAVILNGMVLFLVGLAMLVPHEKLKVWWRRRTAGEERYFSRDGLAWPWLALGALIAYAMLAAEAAGMQSAIPISKWRLELAALQILTVLVFVTRDILFLQWCNLTNMKRPIIKGFFYLCLYYFAVMIVAGVVAVSLPTREDLLVQLLTPYGPFLAQASGSLLAPGIYIGLGVQLALILLVLKGIGGRLSRPAGAPVASVA